MLPHNPENDLSGRKDEFPYGDDPEQTRSPDETDSVEDVLSQIELPEVEDVEEFSEGARLDTEMAAEVGRGLAVYGWEGVADMPTEDFLELCDRLGIEPDIRRAIIAIEDLGFIIEDKNYKSHALTRVPSLEDIEDESKAEDNWQVIESLTTEAYLELSGFLKDPILRKLQLLGQRSDLLEALDKVKKRKVSSIEEYDERQNEITELEGQYREVNRLLEELLAIDEITERRERAFRRMNWLTDQDFMKQPLEEFNSYCRKNGGPTDFQTFAEAVAGKYTDVLVPIADGSWEESDIPAELQATGKVIRKYEPGTIDKLLEEHLARMAVKTGKTNTDRENEALMLRRLQQAKALCVAVFQNDIADRIYEVSPIPESEYQVLEFVRTRLYSYGDADILDEFLSFMPGSQLRDSFDNRLDIPLSKFSGRTITELFEEIDTIINEHPDLQTETITALMEAREARELSRDHYIELAIDAYHVLEKLVYKENHSVRHLISEE